MSDIFEILAGLAAAVSVVAFLATVAESLVEGLIVPMWNKFKLDPFWLLYVGWVVAGALVFLSGINLFKDMIPYPLVGQILTAIVAGRGSNVVHDLFSAQRKKVEARKMEATLAETQAAYYQQLGDLGEAWTNSGRASPGR